MIDVRYPQDCRELIDVAAEHGYELTLKQAEELWELVSEDWGCVWLDVPHYSSGTWDLMAPDIDDYCLGQ